MAISTNSTLYMSHPDCELHDMGDTHPESPARLSSINMAVQAVDWESRLISALAPELDVAGLYAAHPKHYVSAIFEKAPSEGIVALDPDTRMNPHSLQAARLAAGAGVSATERVLAGEFKNAFCAVRPPGHHAESAISMGFCMFNSIALAAHRALASGAARVAILDFDVHHGNGTVEIFADNPDVLVCSSFQWPFYPGRFDQVDLPNIVLTPLEAGTRSAAFRSAIERDWEAALNEHRPDIIFVSAGFDAHIDDPLGGLNLTDADYAWLGVKCTEWADRYAGGRLVSMLEGGYDLDATARSTTEFVRKLAGL